VFDIFLLKTIAKALILPPTGLLLVAITGLVVGRNYPRSGRAIALTAMLLLLALSTPLVSSQLIRLLDDSPALDQARAHEAQAIVILGGGVRRHAPEYGGDTLGRLTLERVRYGARVARQTGLPVLVTGGSVLRDGESEAKLMRDALENEFGVKVRWFEDRSRNTRENASFSAAVLDREGIKRVVLVMHSFDVPRARAEFLRAGIEVIPAPTGIPSGEIEWPGDYLPGIGGLATSYYACYELAALAWRSVYQSAEWLHPKD
jgi:uncharacterized SAM-binding protein YcdF (DUF218 family)